jgi:hypothetical protein
VTPLAGRNFLAGVRNRWRRRLLLDQHPVELLQIAPGADPSCSPGCIARCAGQAGARIRTQALDRRPPAQPPEAHGEDRRRHARLKLPRLINGDYHVGTTSADEIPLDGAAA